EGFGKLPGDLDILLLLDAPPNGHDDFGLRQVDGLLRFLKDFLRLVADDTVGNVDGDGLDGSGVCTRLDLISAKRAVLTSDEPRSVAWETYVGGELALKHLAGEDELVSFFLVADRVADHAPLQCRGELWHEVAYLVGVRHQDKLGLLGADELL